MNFLQSEVKNLVRNKPSSPLPGSSSNLLSETVLHDLDSTMQLTTDETDCEVEVNGQPDAEINTVGGSESLCGTASENTQNLDDSITVLKETVNADTNSQQLAGTKEKPASANSNKTIKCCESCKVKPTAKTKYDQIQCIFCMCWYHEMCVGIKKDDPIGIWFCSTCRKVPSDLQNDINSLKTEVNEIKTCTRSVLKAIEGLSMNFANTFGSIKDQMTSLSRQINSKELCISESIENLQTTTNNLKTSMDQKTCQLINKTTAVYDKVKAHTDNSKTVPHNSQKQLNEESSEPLKRPNVPAVKTNKSKGTGRYQKPTNKQQLPKGRAISEQQRQHQRGPEVAEASHTRVDSVIDLVERKRIQQQTLLVGSSILKGVRNNQLKPNTTVRSFPGATTVTLKEKLRAYNLEQCKTIIVHVGGNDADDGKDLDTFCDDYISLLDSLSNDDRRIIVSGLLPRKGINLEPYNEQLKAICEENNIEFINNFDDFLYASGELPATYFHKDKLHLNFNGTKKLLSNVDKTCKVTRPDTQGYDAPAPRMPRYSGFGRGHQSGRRPRSNPKYCHICSKQGHSTQDCYFNGRMNETSRYFSE